MIVGRRVSYHIYLYGVIAMAVAYLTFKLDTDAVSFDVGYVLLFTLALIVETIEIPLVRGFGTVTYGVTLATMVLYGPALAALQVLVVSVLSPILLLKKRNLMMDLFSGAQYVFCVFLAYGTYVWFGGTTVHENLVSVDNLMILIVTSIVFFFANHAFVDLLYLFRGDPLKKNDFLSIMRSDAANYAISMPFSLIIILNLNHLVFMVAVVLLPLALMGQMLRLYQRLKTMNRIHKMISELQSEFDMDAIYSRVVKTAQKVTASGAVAALWVVDSDRNRLFAGSAYPEESELTIPIQGVPANHGVFAQSMQSGEPTIIRDTRTDSLIALQCPTIAYESLLIVPLKARNQVLGVIAVYGMHKNSFSELDVRHISILAGHAGILLENAKLYGELQESSIRDSNTGLYNYRFFYQELHRRFSEAKRQMRDFSVVILDIDHFKKFNDTYGHVVGDEVLRQVGLLIRDSVGDRGIVARYGGEEFGVLLDSSLEESHFLVERIRSRISEIQFSYQGYTVQGITVSVGIASYPDHDEDEKELLEKADQALYWGAKERGRNKVAIYSSDFDSHLFVDELTGLHTYHYLHIRLMEELPANQGETNMCLIFFDIVDFDRVNRKFGFEFGNLVLQNLALIIKKNIRGNEVASRYGGDEFLLLVPGVSKMEAVTMAERIMRAIEKYHFITEEGHLVHITVRSNVLSFPEDTSDSHQFVSRIVENFRKLSKEFTSEVAADKER